MINNDILQQNPENYFIEISIRPESSLPIFIYYHPFLGDNLFIGPNLLIQVMDKKYFQINMADFFLNNEENLSQFKEYIDKLFDDIIIKNQEIDKNSIFNLPFIKQNIKNLQNNITIRNSNFFIKTLIEENTGNYVDFSIDLKNKDFEQIQKLIYSL